MADQTLATLLSTALQNRMAFIKKLQSEGTDALRLFHGITEGFPGISIDQYGASIVIQSFRTLLAADEIDTIKKTIKDFIPDRVFFIYRHRNKNQSELRYFDQECMDTGLFCSEMKLKYKVMDFNQGLDPLLFLDLRSGRRYLADICSGKSVLNLFAYTCSAGIIAAAHGASSVTNVDFSKTWLNYGKINQTENSLADKKIDYIQDDFFPVIRQFSGLNIARRGARKNYKRFAKQKFDIIFMDPPTLAKSSFGTVDIINDYQSLFKPAMLSLTDNGELICTNHAASVDIDVWIESLKRCTVKAGKSIKAIKRIFPDEDFPSFDNNPPLKILSIQFDE